MSDNKHAGHRKRLTKRFLESGFNDFEPHNILEFILFFSLTRRDTNELAHDLINRFGSFSSVLEAPYHELLKVKGIGPRSASHIVMFLQVFREYEKDRYSDIKTVPDVQTAGNLLMPRFVGLHDEHVAVACLDSKRKLLKADIIFKGSVNAVQISVRKVMEFVLQFKGTAVIIAHNHPGGIALPSAEDISTTTKIKQALVGIGVELIDHLIFADDDFTSMTESRVL